MVAPAGSVKDLGLSRAGPTAKVRAYKSTTESIAETARKAREARLDPDLRRWAAEALMAAGIDGRGNPGTIIQKCQAIVAAYLKSVIYSSDPSASEWIQAPHVTLCLRDLCIPIADCDDGVAAVAGALLTLGMFPFIVWQKFGDGAQEHVLVGIYDERDRKVYLDTANTTTNVYYGPSRASWEEWIDPLEQVDLQTGSAGPDFVTLGAVGLGRRMETSMPAPQINPQLSPTPVGLGLISIGDMDQLDAQVQAEVTGLQDAVKSCPNLPQPLQDSITGFATAWAVLHNQWQGMKTYEIQWWNPTGAIAAAIQLQFSTLSTDMRGYLARAQDYKAQIHAACPSYTPTPGPVVPVPAPDTPSPATQFVGDLEKAAKAVGGIILVAGVVYGGFKLVEIAGPIVAGMRKAT